MTVWDQSPIRVPGSRQVATRSRRTCARPTGGASTVVSGASRSATATRTATSTPTAAAPVNTAPQVNAPSRATSG